MARALSFVHLRFTLRAERSARLPPFPGPTLRGGLGHVLRRMVCVTRMPTCDPCPLRHHCAFPVLFQPYAPPEHPAAARYARMPPPFAIRVPFAPEPFLNGEGLHPQAFAPGDPLVFELVLIGPALLHLPYYVYAIMRMAEHGIGAPGQRFALERVEVRRGEGWQALYPGEEGTMEMPDPVPLSEELARFRLPDPHRLRLRFRTPLRLDLDRDLIYPVEFTHLVRALLQRWRTLEACYGALEDLPPAEALLREAQGVRRVEDRTRWLDLRRFSTRQREAMRIGGAVGEVSYVSESPLTPFALLLALGQLLHVGKLVSMGLGQLEVNPL